jgi:hypothetical protein
MREANMKTILVSALAVSLLAGTAARAAQSDDVLARLAAMEKELAAIRRENAALREIKTARAQNAALKSATTPAPAVGVATEASVKRDPLRAYAADMPMAIKAPPLASAGQLRVWGEGGAIFSGGDPVYSFFDRLDLASTEPGYFSLKPDTGWQAAAGFDYRFADSLWHASAQFRYGESRTSDARAFLASVPPSSFTANPVADMTQTHWLADVAMGRDVIGTGANAMQVKFGLRTAELRSSIDAANPVALIEPPAFTRGTLHENQESKFFGAGPRAGVEGSVPLGQGWAFDYLGDAAVLFGTQNFQLSRFVTNAATNIAGANFAPATLVSVQSFKTVFNADIQVGVSYWVMPNVKVSASYRLDAYFNALNGLTFENDTTKLEAKDRYIHGPHVGVSATF